MQKTGNAQRSYTKQLENKVVIHLPVFLLRLTKSNPFRKMEGEEKYRDENKINSCHHATWRGESKRKRWKGRTKLSSNKAWAMVQAQICQQLNSQLKINFILPYTHLTMEGKTDLDHTGWGKNANQVSQDSSLPCFAAQVTVSQAVSLLLNWDMGGHTIKTKMHLRSISYYTQKPIPAINTSGSGRLLSDHRTSFCVPTI